MNPFVAEIDTKLADRMISDLNAQGFEIKKPAYTLFQAKKSGVSCTLYTSGKLVVQGKEMASFIEFYLEPEILKALTFTHAEIGIDQTGRIGIDESGKGDFFGPLCIAGVYAEGDAILALREMGVRDSKKMNDKAIAKVAEKIRANYAHQIVKINPLKYNELYGQFKNLNSLLAWGHATTIEQLVEKTKCKNVIIDQFAAESVVANALKRKKMEVNLTQRHRGEEDLVVAAASILARFAFVDGMDKLSQEFGMELPKGASAATISAAKDFVQKFGRGALGQVAKLHFKTADLC